LIVKLPDIIPSGGGPPVSIAVRWKLLDRLHAPNRLAVFAAMQIAATALVIWHRTAMAWVLVWCVASLGLLAGRVALSRAYRVCNEGDDPELWASRFTICAWAAAALWGMMSVVIVLTDDAVVHFVVVAALFSNVFAVVTRNACEPRAALGQLCLIKVPLALACVAVMDVTYFAIAGFVVVELIVARSTIRLMCRQTVDLLEANEQLLASRDQLEEANQQLEAMATTDALTGMGNRRGFDLALRREWRRALREHQPISLLLLDLDHFKRLNDTQGHQAGDECLRRVGECIARAIRRPADVAARYGGEEFAVVLPDTDAVAARMMAERVRAAIAAMRIDHPASQKGIVTTSVGSATALPDEALMPAVLIKQADAALYRAKGAGRDCVSVWDEPLANYAPVETMIRRVANS
jgi:diguanylate cyclase (GGDEF)-like protein